MKKITKGILLIIISLMLIMAVNWYYQNKKAMNICKDKCYYQNYESLVLKRGIGWYYPSGSSLFAQKAFETQEQCIDYCLNIE